MDYELKPLFDEMVEQTTLLLKMEAHLATIARCMERASKEFDAENEIQAKGEAFFNDTKP